MIQRQDKTRKRIVTLVIVVGLLASMTALEMTLSRSNLFDSESRLAFFVIVNLNIIALVWLLYFAIKSVRRLIEERRRGTVGYRLKTKLVLLFIAMTFIPVALMYIVASELGTRYIDRFFTPRIKQPIESSLVVAKRLYQVERGMALEIAKMALAGMPLPEQYEMRRVAKDGDKAALSPGIMAAFEGREEAEVISSDAGDVIRASVPIQRTGIVNSVLVIETRLPSYFTKDVENITIAYEDYIRLERRKGLVITSYLLFLLIFALMILFAAIVLSMRAAEWLIEPVKRLAIATGEVATGNYNVEVRKIRDDETGLLVQSFNQMVRHIRETNESLEKAYLNLQNIVRSIQSGVITLDASSNILMMNEAAERIFNVQAGDLAGRPYHELIERIGSAQLMEIAKGIVVKTFREAEHDLRITIDGRHIDIRLRITGLKGGGGEHLGMLVMVDDLTDVIKAQRAMAWQEVARRMAHEIKNPLTPIKLSAERLLRKWEKRSDDFGPVLEQSLTTIIREVDGLRAMVDEFSKIGRMPEAKLLPGDLREIVGQIRSLYANDKRLVIETRTPESPAMVMMDQDLMRRAVINIVDNAREAMEGQGRVDIEIKPVEGIGRYKVSISDTGPGISMEDRERLFMPYFTTRKNGTGLGLAIVEKIVKEHGGSIRHKDNQPHGSVFVIELPALA